METFIIYMAKVSGLIAVFFLAYHLLLRKETFFSSNIGFLLAGLFTAALLPLIEYTKVIWVKAAPATPFAINSIGYAIQNGIQQTPEAFTINWSYVALGIYSIGVLFFLVRIMAEIIRVKRMVNAENTTIQDGYKFIDSVKVVSPFSFFGYIVYNSSMLQPQELKSIIAHEKVHSRQWHSADMLIGQLFCAAFWFNPFVWLYKKAIVQNLEFIADAEATKALADKVAYQKTLLKITLQPECIAITNHFYQSLIKKRIIMLNKKQSKTSNSLKYVAVLPALAAFAFTFQYKVVAQEKEVALLETAYTKPDVLLDTAPATMPDVVIMEVNKDLSELDFKKNIALFKKVFNADVTFNKVKRNSKGEIIAITVIIKDKDHQNAYPVREMIGDYNNPITTFTFGIEKDEKTQKNNIFFSEHPQATITIDDANNEDPAITYLKKSGKGLNRLIVINGVMQPGSEVIIPTGQRIKDMTELEANYAAKKYGDKAKDGAVELTTISTDDNATTQLVITPFSQDGAIVDLGYIVKKDSKEEALETYKEALKLQGITMTYDGILRNNAGYITSIHIKLNDDKKNKAEGTWEVKGSDKPIGDIYIGRKKGLLLVLEQK